MEAAVFGIEISHRQPPARFEQRRQALEDQRHVTQVVQRHRADHQVKTLFWIRLSLEIPKPGLDIADAGGGEFLLESLQHALGGIKRNDRGQARQQVQREQAGSRTDKLIRSAFPLAHFDDCLDCGLRLAATIK